MDQEVEVIQQQMRATRQALSQKLQTLEDHVTGTVKDAVTTVRKTIDTVTASVQGIGTDARETVHETVAAVNKTLHEAAAAAGRVLDVKGQVQQRPWTMLGLSVAAGYFAGLLLRKSTRTSITVALPQANGNTTHKAQSFATHNGGLPPTESARRQMPGTSAPPVQSFAGGLTDTLAAEVGKLKGLGIGMAIGLIRDLAIRSSPESIAGRITEVMDSITVKIGGEPVQGPVLHNLAPNDSDLNPGVHEERASRGSTDPGEYHANVADVS
jgi:ElaB/YqjD/DUF883 family membrane-anchored ribosome-binding protein